MNLRKKIREMESLYKKPSERSKPIYFRCGNDNYRLFWDWGWATLSVLKGGRYKKVNLDRFYDRSVLGTQVPINYYYAFRADKLASVVISRYLKKRYKNNIKTININN